MYSNLVNQVKEIKEVYQDTDDPQDRPVQDSLTLQPNK